MNCAPPPAIIHPAPVIYGFKGIDGRFDRIAFECYARSHGMTPTVIFAWRPGAALRELAERMRGSPGRPIAYYGYSLGSQTANMAACDRALPRPVFVTTMGAFRAANLSCLVKLKNWNNYPDDSSGTRGAPALVRGEGRRLLGPHRFIQAEMVR